MVGNRPRSSSVQIPFMGGTIVPSNEIEAKVKKLKMRRKSLPAHHTIHDRYFGVPVALGNLENNFHFQE